MEIQQVLETLSFGFEEKDWHIVFLATHEKILSQIVK